MIRLFLADVDGCLSEPYVPFDLDGFRTLRGWAARAEADPRYPRLGLCTGRSYAYAEAVAQALGLAAPVLFESGGGRFDLPEARITWNPELTPETEAALAAAKAFLLERVVPRAETVSYDYGKRTQAGIVSPVVGECAAFVDEVQAFVDAEGMPLVAYHTPFSVDVVPTGLTKVRALEWVAGAEGLPMDALAFIGDTNGDAAAIAACGLGFAPANGADTAKAAADVVTAGAVLDGVLEAYRACLARNGVEVEAPVGG